MNMKELLKQTIAARYEVIRGRLPMHDGDYIYEGYNFYPEPFAQKVFIVKFLEIINEADEEDGLIFSIITCLIVGLLDDAIESVWHSRASCEHYNRHEKEW